MFDHALSQYAPSRIERFGVRLHGLVHYYTDQPIQNINSARKRDIKVVTNGGKTFYPFENDQTNYSFFYIEGTPIGKTVLYQHPLAVMEQENGETGEDWSGYALINNLIPVYITGMKGPQYNGYPVTLDDQAMAVYANGAKALSFLLEWPSGSGLPDEVDVNKTGEPIIGTVTSTSPDGRKHIIVYPSFWDDALSGTNHLTLINYSGVWPNVNAHVEYIENVNESSTTLITDGNKKTIQLDCRPPDIGACYMPAADLSFKTVTINESVPSSFADNTDLEKINKTLISASVSNDGAIAHLKLIYRLHQFGSKTQSLTGSIAAEEFDDANDFCKTDLQPTGWHRYKGSMISYTETSITTGGEDYSIAIEGWEGVSEYIRNLYSKITSTTVRVDGFGTMEQNSEVSTVESINTLSIEFEGVAIDHGIAKPQITDASFTAIAGNPFVDLGYNKTYEYIWVYESGSRYDEDGSNVALIKVYLHQYSADMFSLACGIAKGTITDEEFGKKFNVTSKQLRIGSVFSHGRYHAGSFIGDDIVNSTFGASNPKTGEIVRDMPYPVVYI